MRWLLRDAVGEGDRLFTSAEVLQVLLHAYLPVEREAPLAAAMRLATTSAEVVPLEAGHVVLAAQLHSEHPRLGARDPVHLAVCMRRDAITLPTFDRGLEAAIDRAS